MAAKFKVMGVAEIRQRLGVSRQRAQQITGRRDFPEPYQKLAMGQVWNAEDVETWIRANRPALAEEPEGGPRD